MKGLIALLLSLYSISISDSISFQSLGAIEGNVKEVSGIVGLDANQFLVIGDSGNEPALYKMNDRGKHLKKIYLEGSINIDWEEIQMDQNQSVFIGDFGNNLNYRQDLKIYKIPNGIDKLDQDTLYDFESIEYHYSDQIENPLPNGDLNFDAEAFIIFNDKIHLFSKNHGSSGYSKRYELPSYGGTFEAELIDSIYTDTWITGAHYHRESDRLYLLSDQKIMIYDDYSTNSMAGPTVEIALDAQQLEGIYVNEFEEIFLTEDAETEGEKSILYRLLLDEVNDLDWKPFPNPCQDLISIKSNEIIYCLALFDGSGRQIEEYNFRSGIKGTHLSTIDLDAGLYFIKVKTKDKTELKRFFKI